MTTGDANAVDRSPLFIDTNVLVYAAVASAPFHQQARAAVDAYHQAGVPLWLSRQVLREYLAVLSRPQTFTAPIAAQTLAAHVRQFETSLNIAEEHATVTQRLLDLIEQLPIGGRQVHDANIIATMQAYGINRLLTHNVADFTRFAHLITVVPLEP